MSKSKKPQDSGVAIAFQQAQALQQQGRLGEAESLYRAILEEAPGHAATLHGLGTIAGRRSHLDEALQLFRAALKLNPADASVHESMGNALLGLRRPDEALVSYDRALSIKPHHAEAHYRRGNALRALKRHAEAIASYDCALAIRPDYAEALNNRGNALCELKRQGEALLSYDRALAIRPDYAEALNNRGNALRDLKRLEEALVSYDRALALNAKFAAALNNRGNTLLDLNRPEEALACYELVLAINPKNAEALNHRGNALHEMNRNEEAARDFQRLLRMKPDFEYARGKILGLHLLCCDWKDYAADAALIASDVAAGKRTTYPLIFLSISDSPRDQLRCAETYVKDSRSRPAQSLWKGERYRHDRIRVAYLSADYRNHPVAYLTAGLFEAHDRARFETTALSFGPKSTDDMRARLEGAFDRFVDVQRTSDHDAALLLKQLEIDIAVDLMGYTRGGRTDILAFRPAPIQINFLGYPGTMGADHMDYILADRFVIPEDQQSFYTEKVAYLPNSFQPNDSKRRIGERVPTRKDAGLPETGFVFCSFNNHYKIVPPMFDVWMRLLRQVEGSVLWLRQDNAAAVHNLRHEAETRGVAPDRLIFAPRTDRLEDHLARHRLAGCFLDTRPYNAHTTASDALWAGLPVVTCVGTTYAGRVAGSLLNAAGLSELITDNLQDYEELALRLARDQEMLAAIRAKLARNRDTCPLFDTDRFCRHIESAYVTMWERYQRGEPPESFDVVPMSTA